MKSLIRIASMMLTISLYASPVTAQTLDAIKSAKVIRIGVLLEVPPFGLVNKEGAPDGLDVDVAKALAESLGVSAELVPITSPNRIPYLLTNRVDALVAVLAITPERQKQIQFSEPYAGLSTAIIAPKHKKITSWEDLKGLRVSTSRASTSDVALTKNAPSETNIQRFDDEAGALQAMLSEQVDAVATSGTLVDQAERRYPGQFEKKFDMSSQVQGIGLRPGDNDLLQQTNNFVRGIKENGKLNELTLKWLGTEMPSNIKN